MNRKMMCAVRRATSPAGKAITHRLPTFWTGVGEPGRVTHYDRLAEQHKAISEVHRHLVAKAPRNAREGHEVLKALHGDAAAAAARVADAHARGAAGGADAALVRRLHSNINNIRWCVLEAEALKNRDGLHLEQRQVGGAHPHMQRFWVGQKLTTPSIAHAHSVLHGKAADEHRHLAARYGNGGAVPADLAKQRAMEAANPGLDFARAEAHSRLAKLHDVARLHATTAAHKLRMGYDPDTSAGNLHNVHSSIETMEFYARPRHEVEADLNSAGRFSDESDRRREEEDRDGYDDMLAASGAYDDGDGYHPGVGGVPRGRTSGQSFRYPGV